MNLSKSIARLYIQSVSLRGIPEGKPIVNRFFDIYWDARGLRKNLIRQEYQKPEEKREMKYTLGVRNRVMFPISLQTASIAMANGVTGQELVDVVVDQMFAYGEATIGDDFHDDVLVPKYYPEDCDAINIIYEKIKDHEILRAIAEDIGDFQADGKMIFSVELLNAALKQAEIYKRRMSKKSPKAYETYLKARDELYRIQAKSLFISHALAHEKIPTIRGELMRGGDYVLSAVKLGDKLAFIGQENAAIVFEATQPKDISDDRAERIKAGLRLFYHGSTLLKQFTEDDSLRLKKDIEKRADNLWVLLALQEHEEISEDSIKTYLKSNPKITQKVLTPSVNEIRRGYQYLKDLDYDVSDLQLAIGLITRQAERDMGKFERRLGIDLDKEWLKEAIKLRELIE